jgi:hypothetical protein
VSARSGKPSEYFSSNFFCRAGASGLMPTIAVSPMSPAMSRSAHDWVVHPGP